MQSDGMLATFTTVRYVVVYSTPMLGLCNTEAEAESETRAGHSRLEVAATIERSAAYCTSIVFPARFFGDGRRVLVRVLVLCANQDYLNSTIDEPL
jgi:hypothetical protein